MADDTNDWEMVIEHERSDTARLKVPGGRERDWSCSEDRGYTMVMCFVPRRSEE